MMNHMNQKHLFQNKNILKVHLLKLNLNLYYVMQILEYKILLLNLY